MDIARCTGHPFEEISTCKRTVREEGDRERERDRGRRGVVAVLTISCEADYCSTILGWLLSYQAQYTG